MTLSIFFPANIVPALKENLGKVKTITGSLQIKRSFPIMSLDFFDSLELIQGIQTKEATSHQTNQFSLEITENENLQKLFPFKSSNKTVKIEWRQSKDSEDGPMPGKALIHFNPNLCYNVIEKMIKASNLEEPKEGDANSQKDISRSGH